MDFSFYILYSTTLDKFYIGHTGDDIAERLRKHLSDYKGFTAKAKDWVVVYRELFAGKFSAYKREVLIKSWKSDKKIGIIIAAHSSAGSTHPDL